MWLIGFERKLLESEGKQVLNFGVDPHRGERPRLSRELQPRLLEMVVIEMSIAERVHEFARLQIGGLRDHHRQECIRRDVERYAEKGVAAPLVHLARKP